MSDTEWLIWAAVFATKWTVQREAQRKYGGEDSAAAIGSGGDRRAPRG